MCISTPVNSKRTFLKSQFSVNTSSDVMELFSTETIHLNTSVPFTPAPLPNDPRMQTMSWIISIASPILCCLGLIGNTLNVIVLWHSSRLTGIFYVYLRWLAVADFGFIFIWSFFQVYHNLTSLYKTNIFFVYFDAHAWTFLRMSFAGVSSVLTMLLTSDRHLAVCHPLDFRQFHTKRVATITIVLTFVLVIALHVPYIFEKRVMQKLDPETNLTIYNSRVNHSVKDHWLFSVWTWVKAITTQIAPLVCLIILNPLIIRKHRQSREFRRHLSASQTWDQKSMERQGNRILVLLVSVTAIFIVCVLPAVVRNIIGKMLNKAAKKSFAYRLFFVTTNILEPINFVANFYVYSLTSSDFRLSFKEVFSGCLQRSRQKRRLTSKVWSTIYMRYLSQSSTSSLNISQPSDVTMVTALWKSCDTN